MSVFSAMLYIGDKACRYKLDELIRRSFNGFLDRDISCTDQKLYCPVVKEDDAYFLEIGLPTWSFWVNGKEASETGTSRIRIQHGDYLQAEYSGTAYEALFLEDSRLTMSSVLYTSTFASPVLIGRGEDMNVVIDTSLCVSRQHARIQRQGTDVVVEELRGQTGVYVNGTRCSRQPLVNGDEISIGGVSIIFVGTGIILPSFVEVNKLQRADKPDVTPQVDPSGQSEFVRVLRRHQSLSEGTFDVDPPTAPDKVKDVPFLLAAGPSLTMSLAMMVSLVNAIRGSNTTAILSSSVMSASMLAGALLWPKLMRSYNEKQRKAAEEHRQKRYGEYIDKLEAQISSRYNNNTRIWEIMFPPPQNLLELAEKQDSRIWERTPRDEDFLSLRLGLGERPFEYEIKTRKQGFVLHEDQLESRGRELRERYDTLRDVPVTLSLMEKKTVGVIGRTHDVAKILILNLAFFHASEDVKIVLVYNRFQAEEYGALSTLPHIWSDDRTRRYVATTKAEAHALFSVIDEEIQRRETQLRKDDQRLPHYVCMVFDSALLEDVPCRRYLLDNDNTVGMSTVFFGEQLRDVPKECSRIIDREESYCGIYFVNENQNRFVHYKPDNISDPEYAGFISRIAQLNIREGGRAARIPERVTFLDTYQVGNVAALGIQNRWSTNASDKSLAAIIGVRAGNEAFMLDIHQDYHGCHGLVAGTTGSGKSEFLQAYILSLMINFSPNEVGFVLVDFKGGDMARPFLKAPHLAAVVSNLSENTLYRALVSLDAEVRTRQNIFNEAASQLGVDKLDINSYHRYFKERRLTRPLPHLIIVIDEFAQLKTQNPEFMTKLISIAQVGRSLGIHLILATQKPNGVVDPQIWSNSRFKVCLKVADTQDSKDMIGRPEAALIKQPGRAYVQVGYDEVFEQIQSGYSGAEYIAKDRYVDDESATVSLINAPCERLRTAKDTPASAGKDKKSQISSVVSEIRALGQKLDLQIRPLWLPPLPEALAYEECDGICPVFDPARLDQLPPGKAICGRLDIPATQEQPPYELDFLASGHLAVYGSTGSGTSTFIQMVTYSMALRYSPDWFRLVVMDFDGGSLIGLSGMPHCIGYATGDDPGRIEQTIAYLQKLISERRALFAEYSCANYESYIAASGHSMPLVLMILDNYAVFRENMYPLEDKLIRVIAAAENCGIFAIITGNSKNAIYHRVVDHMAQRIVFTMNDSGTYRDLLNMRTPVRPEGEKGRALVVHDGSAVEVQIGVPFDLDNEADRNRQIAQVYEEMKRLHGDGLMNSIFTDDDDLPPIPQGEPVVDLSMKLAPLPLPSSLERPLMLGTNGLIGSVFGFETAGSQCIYIVDRDNGPVTDLVIEKACEAAANVYVISDRNRRLPAKAQPVMDLDQFVDEHFTGSHEPGGIYIIDSFCDFFDRISDEALSKLERFLRNPEHGCCFITTDDTQRTFSYNGAELYNHLVHAENGLVVGGNIDDHLAVLFHQRFSEIPKNAREKKLRADQAFAYCGTRGGHIDLFMEGVSGNG